eukprot:TRINITY_DN7099_c4_g1_i1.p1 TRINITY_DN7099_c4_g1~~TRINITY_DN7099_c4_g1_i1.p1  ORF type:complete len:421 (+),score=46.92 TRINITY_DN7099_c4_g1_i1:89-1351(+)
MVKARSVQCMLLLAARLFQQFMRNILAPLIVYMDLGDGSRGVLLSAVAAGYFFTQVPGGALADKIGAKNVVTVAILGSALCCLAIPYAYEMGLSYMWWCLVFMGMIQGPLFPTSSVFLSQWMPPEERAWAATMLDIGISIGALISVPAGGYLGSSIGWQNTYITVACFTFVYVAAWVVLGSESPEKCFFIGKDEKEHLRAVVPGSKGSGSGPAKGSASLAVMTHPAVLAVFISHIAFNYGAYFVTNWNPTYYKDVLGMDAAEASIYLTLPHVSNLVGKLMNNPISAYLTSLGFTRLRSRRFFTVVSAVGSGVCLAPVFMFNNSVLMTTALMVAANFFFGLAPSGFKANYLDITVLYMGVISGVGNTLGTVASYFGPLVVSHILDEYNSWSMIFLSILIMNCVTALFFVMFSSDKPVEQQL